MLKLRAEVGRLCVWYGRSLLAAANARCFSMAGGYGGWVILPRLFTVILTIVVDAFVRSQCTECCGW